MTPPGMRQRKIRNEEIATCEGAEATEPPGGGFGRGVPPPAEYFAIEGTEQSPLNAYQNPKHRKIATCEGAQRPYLLGVGSEGGFPLP